MAPRVEIDPASKAKEKLGFADAWYKKWLDLFSNLLGVKDLEATVKSLTKADSAGRVKAALDRLQSEEKEAERLSFLQSLTRLLVSEGNHEAEIKQLLDDTLGTTTDPEAKKVVDGFRRVSKDKKKDKKEFEKASKEVENKRDNAIDQRDKKLKKIKVKDDEELKRIRGELDETLSAPKPLTRAEAEAKVDSFWVEAEVELVTSAQSKGRTTSERYRLAMEKRELMKAKELYKKIKANKKGTRLTKDELKLLDSFLFKHVGRDTEGVNLAVDMLAAKLAPQDFKKLIMSVYKQSQEAEEQPTESKGGRGNEAQGGDKLSKLYDVVFGRRGAKKKNYGELDENDWENLRVSGMLNINAERYSEINEDIKKKFGWTENALVVDLQRKTAKLKDSLTDDQKKQVNAYFKRILNGEVRMMVDESVQISNSNIDARATEYVTLMSVMGLDTSMKSDVMNRAKAMTFAFMIFNSSQTPEGYQQLCEYAAQIGSEYSVFEKVMKMRERIVINVEGREVEMGDLSQIDFVNVASQAIVDEEDRTYYGLPNDKDADGKFKVGRTYADMLMASNRPDEKSKARIPVMRLTLKERLGDAGYDAMLYRIGAKVKGKRGRPDTYDPAKEEKYLQAAGDKYWDYFNGIYTYYLMTRSTGEFVGNAHPDNSKLVLPAGLNENFSFKMDPSAWVLFTETYNVPNFPEVMQLFRFNGNSSLASKEGKEVFSYLIQTERDPVAKLPTIADAFYGAGNVPPEDKLVKLRAAFVKAIFLPDQYKLGGKTAELAERSHIYDSIPLKYDKNGVVTLDATAQRRDFLTARKELRKELTALWTEDNTIFDNVDMSLLKKEFAHDDVMIQRIDAATTGLDKMMAFADRYGEDKLMFVNLSNKRPDDFTKYAIDYHKEWQTFAAALAAKPTWATYIKAMAVVEKIVGKASKIDPIAIRGYKYMVELRKARVMGEKYVRQIQKNGGLEYKDGGYMGELPGHFPIPDLEERKVTFDDIQQNGGKPTSIVAMRGAPGEVDGEEAEKHVLSQMRMASLITEDTLKHERKHFAKELLAWHFGERPFLTEAWDILTAKKYINYLAIEVFDMPPEYFLEFVIGATGDFVSLWWKYFNGQGGGHH